MKGEVGFLLLYFILIFLLALAKHLFISRDREKSDILTFSRHAGCPKIFWQNAQKMRQCALK